MANTGTRIMEEDAVASGRLALTLQQKMQIDFAVKAAMPSTATAYVLCILLGAFGAHRFYLGAKDTGRIMFVLGITVLGIPVSLMWAVVDLFSIPAMIAQRADALRERLTDEARADGGARGAPARDQWTKRATTSR
jgi:TM2 domain-containing membrane protein YozV